MAADHLSTTFAALADPTRRAILGRLVQGQTSVTELAKPFKMSLPGISKHLKVLERAGLIKTEPRSASGGALLAPCGTCSRTSPPGWNTTRRFWEESLDRLDDYLHELQAEKRRNMARSDSRTSNDPLMRVGGSGVRHHARLRRAASARFQGVDRSETYGAMVGATRLHESYLRNGCATGWRLSHRDARS